MATARPRDEAAVLTKLPSIRTQRRALALLADETVQNSAAPPYLAQAQA
jgi:hypothetical protein